MTDEIDKILEYILIQFRKPIPSDIREEVVTMGDQIVLSEAKQAIQAIIDRSVAEAEIRLLKDLANQADKEYDRTEIDNWTFSLGALTHDRILKATLTEQAGK